MNFLEYKIPFNKPHIAGKELHYVYDAMYNGQLSGNGKYTKECQRFLKDRYGFGKCLLTTSCTDALEMAAILLNIKEGDEVIIPSYTFVSTANAFVLRGAKIVFVDCKNQHPCINEDHIEPLISHKTKAIVVVHYAGIACDMDKIMRIAQEHDLFVVEDAAQAIDSYYIGKDKQKKALGTFGHLSTFSFHETKNIISGEGGMLAVNDPRFESRAEIIWEKGTNRVEFFRGESDKYGWVDIGSSFLPSEIIAAFLFAQLEELDVIQERRRQIWSIYHERLSQWATSNRIEIPEIPSYATNNAHMYYLVCHNQNQRQKLIDHLKMNGILAVFHYLSLHRSIFYSGRHDGRVLKESDRFSESLLRLPLFYRLSDKELHYIIDTIIYSKI